MGCVEHMNIQSDTRATSDVGKTLIGLVIIFTFATLCGSALFFAVQDDVRENQNERETRFDIEYHDNGTATIQFTVESERLYADNVTINGQSATRFYDNPPELLPVNQSARIDVSNTDRIVITHNGYVIYEEPVTTNLSNA